MSFLTRIFQLPSQSQTLPFINQENVMSATPEDRKRLIFYFIAHQAPQKLQDNDHESFSQRRLHQVRMYEEAGAIAACTAYVAKSPLFRSWITKNFFVGLGVHLASSAAVYSLTGSFLRTYIEPRFVARDRLVGELAEKYNFTMHDYHKTKEDVHTQGEKEEITSLLCQLRNQAQKWLFEANMM